MRGTDLGVLQRSRTRPACRTMRSTVSLLGLFAGAISAIPLEQQPLNPDRDRSGVDKEIPAYQLPVTGASTPGVRGRFLHITGKPRSSHERRSRDKSKADYEVDFHPDPHYKPYSSIDDGSCHHGKGPAGFFGQEGSECDSPISLVDETFRWIEENLKDEIDFVIWTGDSVRHDNDERIPRTDDEIVELNEFMVQKWVDLFGTRKNPAKPKSIPQLSVPVVPTFGNNDITPHNIFREGPNRWTKKFAELWRHFIPEDQRHSFVEGGWFTTEVIPGQLAVISLNTMYFYESNSAVDGCKDHSEPGYEHMEWLRVQLQILRSRGMKAIVMGHVAPARSGDKASWDETCWQKYTLWMERYRDVVVGSLYGHMNIDHFILQDTHDVDIESEGKESSSDTVSILSKEDYLASLRDQWSELPSPPSGFSKDLLSIDEPPEVGPTKKSKKEKKRRKYLKKIGGEWAERYSVSLVAPSLVPNYFPSLRVIEYNVTGLEENVLGGQFMDMDPEFLEPEVETSPPETQKKKKKKKKGHKKKKTGFELPEPPSPTAPPGPAYSNQPFTWLGYTQYFANLTRINEEVASSGDHKPRVDFEVEYNTGEDDAYQMKDLTVRSFLELARRIGDDGELSNKGIDSDLSANKKKKKKKKKVNEIWRAFLDRAFVGYVNVDELDLNLVR